MQQWLEHAVFYQIYPPSFCDSDSDGIGDIRGIISKLDYVQALGCSGIWLNPCFDSPFTDGGYDIRDYYTVAARYGTNDDLAALFQAAHERGLRVFLDLVSSHTSWEHPWFISSLSPEPNQFSGRYVWTDDRWKNFDGISNVNGCIRGLSDRNGSVATSFYSTQPCLNYGFAHPTESWQCGMDHPDALATKQAFLDIMLFWLGMGCDGFRVDMAHAVIKGDDDHSATMAFWRDMSRLVKEKFPDALLISEWGEPSYSLRGGFDMDFVLHRGTSHYFELFRGETPFFSKAGTGNCAPFVRRYQEYVRDSGGQGIISIPSGNHDTYRLSRWLDGDEMRLAFAFLLSMPGVPFIYYGDEIGMRYREGQPSIEGGFERTGSRSPMQWDRSPNAGFSKARSDRLYMPVDHRPDFPNVQDQQRDPASLLNTVRGLIRLRREIPDLGAGTPVEFLWAEPFACPLVYRRGGVLVVINPAASPAGCTLSERISAGETLYRFGGRVSCVDGHLLADGATAAFLAIDPA